MFSKILIANRGEIACRIIQTARGLGVRTVAIYSDVDQHARHVALADEAMLVGPAPPSESYLNGARIIAIAKKFGVDAIHPGYGFLAECPAFARAVGEAGLVFIGPSPDVIAALGQKDTAKALMQRAGVPVVPGYHGANQDNDVLLAEGEQIGFPLLIKSCAGGGGKALRRVDHKDQFLSALASVRREAKASFHNDRVLLEAMIAAPRHIEVQVFADAFGNAVHLFERDCSVQRRYQKLIEEAPAHGITPALRDAMTSAALKAVRAVDYVGAGTVEFVVANSGARAADTFWFIEMNTRLQVEHAVTEAVTGYDLVAWQIKVAAGEPLPAHQSDVQLQGHALEARLFAEDPQNHFLPSHGHLAHVTFGDARVESGVRQGDAVSPWYDPMLAKLVVHAESRAEAVQKLGRALSGTHIAGLETNGNFLSALVAHPQFVAGGQDAGFLDRNLEALTMVQDCPRSAVVIAALASANVDLQSKFLGWRLWGEAYHVVRVVLDGREVSMQLAMGPGRTVRAQFDDQEILVEDLACDGATWTGVFDGRKVSADVARYKSETGADVISVLAEGQTGVFCVPDAFAPNPTRAVADDVLVAPITGVVRVVDVAEGAEVNAGARLIVIEAMKLEHTLVAPQTARIAELTCKAGDHVSSGTVLVRFASV